jgi:hypothetical protein
MEVVEVEIKNDRWLIIRRYTKQIYQYSILINIVSPLVESHNDTKCMGVFDSSSCRKQNRLGCGGSQSSRSDPRSIPLPTGNCWIEKYSKPDSSYTYDISVDVL